MRLDSDLEVLERTAVVGMHRMFVGWSMSPLVFRRTVSDVVGRLVLACRWGPFRVSVGVVNEMKVSKQNM
jgi:hypothetical protein